MSHIHLLPYLALVSFAGCSTYQGMFFAEHTHVGAQIEISPQASAKPLNVNIGYDRAVAAIVPRTAPGENAGSVISKTDLDIVFATNSTIKNVFATGVAAKNLARSGANVAALFGQCYDETEDLKKKKKAAIDKIATYKKSDADEDTIKELYELMFPKRATHWTTTKDEMIRALIERVTYICDDVDTVKKITDKL